MKKLFLLVATLFLIACTAPTLNQDLAQCQQQAQNAAPEQKIEAERTCMKKRGYNIK
jgi:uncharacterized lipoprotein YajG